MFTRIRQVNDCKKRDFVNGADQPEHGAQRYASRMDGALASGGNGVQEGGTGGKDPELDPQAQGGAAIAAPHGWIKSRLIGREKNPTGGVINVRPKVQRGKENA
jgi:hypothetical protein